MTSKEAFERMKNTLSVDLKEEFYIDDTVIKIDRELIEKDLDILYELVNRDTPKEIYNPYGDEPLCPNCHDEAESYTTFCKKCGQRLDWGQKNNDRNPRT